MITGRSNQGVPQHLGSAHGDRPDAGEPLAASVSTQEAQGSSMGFAIGNVFSAPPADRILGIDPGLQRTGYAVLERTASGPFLVEAGMIRSTEKASLSVRVREIGEGVADVIEEFGPPTLAIEQVFSKVKHPKSALLMSHARGAILFAAAARGLHVVHYSPRQIKKLLTGSGTASKEQVQQAIQREFGLDLPPEPNDVADACAAALCHYHSLRWAVPA